MRTVNSLTCKLGTAIAAYEQPEPEPKLQQENQEPEETPDDVRLHYRIPPNPKHLQ